LHLGIDGLEIVSGSFQHEGRTATGTIEEQVIKLASVVPVEGQALAFLHQKVPRVDPASRRSLRVTWLMTNLEPFENLSFSDAS